MGAASCRAYRTEYDPRVLRSKEEVLRDTLFQFRKSIDMYAADKGALPQSLDDLVRAGYLREVPEDPITEKKDWKIDIGNDSNSSKGAKGIIDVHSASPSHADW